jgi:hypothetical protein
MKTPALIGFALFVEIHETDDPKPDAGPEITSGIKENARIVVTRQIITA